ncbi:nitronate monooxygenase [Paenibacillus thiaminolyticus]|uniref:NAD(P)H-dependent flavin oxidoreductase n=1 Tax=Paenibacillus thiaminolyticus TaxID=49283 RepID=UPI001162A2DD|nr:nitronate monooxygenase [Paenibacillus thiaminolyticus]NGP60408.1 nitronate monooxygenase [Paenibacillus thiaminolyticus]
MTKVNTELCKTLNIAYPIVQAGMAGGPTTPDLVASVSEAGALGTLGAAYMEPEDIRAAVRLIRQRTAKPFAVNLFAADMTDDASRIAEVNEVLRGIRSELELGEPATELHTPDRFEQQMQVLIEEQVPVISTAFGILPARFMEDVKRRGIKVTTMVTTVREAVEAERAGSDVIVAQGSDAGGHRGTFDIGLHPNGANIGTFSLVPQIADQVRVPVVAAGGVMDGRGLVAALALGASGVQLGTRFLTAAESGAHPAYKQALLDSTEESTVITRVFSGRPARGISNAFIRRFDESGVEPLPFPTQNSATNEIRKAAAARNEADYMSLWAGQATRLLSDGDPASLIVMEIMEEAQQLLSELPALNQA